MSLAFTSPTVLFTSRPSLRQSHCTHQATRHARTVTTPRRTVIMTDAAPVDVAATPVETVSDPSDPNVCSILMLCLGNICRSPAAEAVMKNILRGRNVSDKFMVDSCGTGGGSPDWYMEDGFSHHVGAPPDVRMSYAANQRGISVDTQSRPLCKEDLERFDYIVAMDSDNVEAIETARAHWGVDEPKANIILLTEHCQDESFRGQPVPDPYYSRQKSFDYALDMIQDACAGLVDHLNQS